MITPALALSAGPIVIGREGETRSQSFQLAPSGALLSAFHHNIGQEEVCTFLRELLLRLRGSIIVLLDSSSTHKGAPLEQLLGQHRRLRIEHFPSHAPELNPDEGV